MRANACLDCGHPTLRWKCIRCEWRERQAWIDYEREERQREKESEASEDEVAE